MEAGSRNLGNLWTLPPTSSGARGAPLPPSVALPVPDLFRTTSQLSWRPVRSDLNCPVLISPITLLVHPVVCLQGAGIQRQPALVLTSQTRTRERGNQSSRVVERRTRHRDGQTHAANLIISHDVGRSDRIGVRGCARLPYSKAIPGSDRARINKTARPFGARARQIWGVSRRAVVPPGGAAFFLPVGR
jgi:hypothetical protein